MKPNYLRLLLTICLVLPLFVRAQTDTVFFNKDGSRAAERSEARYFRLPAEKAGAGYHVRDYYLDGGALRMDGWYRDAALEMQDGPFTFYHGNGKVESLGRYREGQRDSVWTSYAYEGTLWSVARYRDGQLHGTRTMYYRNGSIKRREQFVRGKMAEGHVYDTHGLELEYFPYEHMLLRPEYRGDVTKFLSKNVVYPKKARKENKEGRVIVQFVVDETGRVTDPVVTKSSGTEELDAEALRVVSSMNRWKAGYEDGEPVKVYFSLPVTFRLD